MVKIMEKVITIRVMRRDGGNDVMVVMTVLFMVVMITVLKMMVLMAVS